MSDDELIRWAIANRADIEATFRPWHEERRVYFHPEPRPRMRHRTPEPGRDRWHVVCPNHGQALNWMDEKPMPKASPFKVVELVMQTWAYGSSRDRDRHVWVGQCEDCGTIHAACD